MNSGQDLSWRVLVADASGDHGELPADQHGPEVLPDHVDDWVLSGHMGDSLFRPPVPG